MNANVLVLKSGKCLIGQRMGSQSHTGSAASIACAPFAALGFSRAEQRDRS